MRNQSYLDNFKWYVDLCHESFKFLLDEYKFKHILTDMHTYEIEIIYRKDEDVGIDIRRVGLGIHWEVPMVLPHITLTKGTGISKRPKIKKYHIENLIGIKCPERKTIKLLMDNFPIKPEIEKGMLSQQEVEMIIKNYSEVLKKYGKDILNGDFSVFEEIEKNKEERK